MYVCMYVCMYVNVCVCVCLCVCVWVRACVHRAHVRIARDFGIFRLCTEVCLKVEAFLVERVCVFGGGVGVLVGTRIQDWDGVTTDRKSKRPLVKTPPSQNVPELVKTSPNTKKDWSKRPHKTSPFFKGDFSKKYGNLTKEKLVLVSGTNVWKFEARKPDLVAHEQQRCRPGCAFMQSDPRRCCSLNTK